MNVMEPGLSPRQREILPLIGAGRTNREIADALRIATGTVKVHISVLMHKFACNRYDLMRVYLRDEQRIRAIRLNQWIQRHEKELSPGALASIKQILAEQVSEVLQ
jgi:DNA-binding NarL/FixJ family response regulator